MPEQDAPIYTSQEKHWLEVNWGGEFKFLEKLDDLDGRHVDNADFFAVSDPATVSDDLLFEHLMGEYPGWLRQAPGKGLLP